MSLQALRIIREEIARAKESTPYARHALLEAVGQTIAERIETECIEVDPKALLRDHMRKGGDPATFELPGEGLPEPERCLQRAGEEDEPAERCLLDPSHEGPCNSDPSRIMVADCNDCRELTVPCHRHTPNNDPICRFCGSIEPKCTGSGFEDGIEAHDFSAGGLDRCTWCHMAAAIDVFMVREVGEMACRREFLCEGCRLTLTADPQLKIERVARRLEVSERDFDSEKDEEEN